MNCSSFLYVISSCPGLQVAKYEIYAHRSSTPFSTMVRANDHIRVPSSGVILSPETNQ